MKDKEACVQKVIDDLGGLDIPEIRLWVEFMCFLGFTYEQKFSFMQQQEVDWTKKNVEQKLGRKLTNVEKQEFKRLLEKHSLTIEQIAKEFEKKSSSHKI